MKSCSKCGCVSPDSHYYKLAYDGYRAGHADLAKRNVELFSENEKMKAEVMQLIYDSNSKKSVLEDLIKSQSKSIINLKSNHASELKDLTKRADKIQEEKSALEAREKGLVDALERIKRFNPSYEYTFENARSIASEAIAQFNSGSKGEG